MVDVIRVANEADLIVNGYAFTRDGSNIRVLNLNDPDKAVVLNADAKVLETSMDDIEIAIVIDYFTRNGKFMEVS